MNMPARPGADLRGKRLEQGWTLVTLAKKCRAAGVPVSASELSRIECNLHAPRPELCKALADLLGLRVSDITGKAPTEQDVRDRVPKNPKKPTSGQVSRRPEPEASKPKDAVQERSANGIDWDEYAVNYVHHGKYGIEVIPDDYGRRPPIEPPGSGRPEETERYWEDDDDGPYATLLRIVETYCHPSAWDGAYDQLRTRARDGGRGGNGAEMRVFKRELAELIRDPLLLPSHLLGIAADYDDGSDLAFLHRLWRDLYGDEPMPRTRGVRTLSVPPSPAVSAEDHISRLGLDQATENALTWAGAKTVADVARLVERDDLGRTRGIGLVRRAEIERALYEAGHYPTPTPCMTGEEHPVADSCPIRCLNVPTRVVGALDRAGARTIAEALQLISRREIRDVRGLADIGVAELRSALIKAGYRQRLDIPER